MSVLLSKGSPNALSSAQQQLYYLFQVMSRSAESASFPLSAAYSLYLAVRCFSQQDKPFLAQFIARVANQLTHIAQVRVGKEKRAQVTYFLPEILVMNPILLRSRAKKRVFVKKERMKR